MKFDLKGAVVALGSNLFDRGNNIKRAIEGLSRLPKTDIVQVSKIYVTKPFLVPDKQDDYLNCCVELKTGLQPKTLLGGCLGIEAAMGRTRPYKNSARIIDIDLLLYENFSCEDDDLILPHPQIKKRAFVMMPLSDLFKDKVAMGFDFSREVENIDKTGLALFEE